jgi:hypothetical protein
MKRQLIIAVLACGAAAANAQGAIYRCGSTYSERPCADGTAVQALSAPAAADVAASRQEAERQAKAADAMEKARLKEEAKPVAAYIPKEKVEETPKLHKPEVFIARGVVERKAAKKKTKKGSA